jgi:GntR family transcriptional regulator
MTATKRINRAKEIEVALLDQLDELHDDKGQLPSEADITRLFKASRVTVREALASLERKGLIVRRHGVGTFVNETVRAIPARLDESVEFGRLIRLSGYQPQVRLVSWRRQPALPDTAARLNVPAGAELLVIEKVFLADGAPVVYCSNVLPLGLVPPGRVAALLTEQVLSEPVYRLLEEWCDQLVDYQIAEVTSCAAEAAIARHLDYPKGHSLLLIEETAYNSDQKPLFLAGEYYRPGLIHFQLLRKPG